MKSKWFELKSTAIALRKKGKSIREIETALGIPRSTLSGWLRSVQLSKTKKNLLDKKHREALIKARRSAIVWHNKQKVERMEFAKTSALETISTIESSKEILELCLALLYLGEGSKKNFTTSMGNSDPLILKFFLKILRSVFKVELSKISLYLHLRADQDSEKMKRYWSQELGMPLDRFRKTSIDKRTIKTPTYEHYKGVCVVDCGNVAIQRKLVYIGRSFCEKTIKELRD